MGSTPSPQKNVFNSKFFSLLTQREVKGVDGKCSFCENTGSCILGPFYDLSRRRKHCHLLLFFNHSIPSSFQHATNLLGFPLSTKVHHSEEKLEIQKITSPASPEGQKEKFSLLPLLFSAISIYWRKAPNKIYGSPAFLPSRQLVNVTAKHPSWAQLCRDLFLLHAHWLCRIALATN